MVDKRTVNWAKAALSKGYSKEQIKNALSQRGFNPADINDLISQISQPSSPLEAPRPTHHYGVWWTGLIVILIAASIATLVFTGNLSLDFGKKETTQINPAQKIAAFSKPGVVLIQTLVSGTFNLAVPLSDPDTGIFMIDPNTNRLIKSEETFSKDFEEGFAGSGFIVSPDGYIITNAHVVDLNSQDYINQFTSNFVQDYLTIVDEKVQKTYGDSIYNYPDIIDAVNDYIYKETYFTNLKINVYVGTGVTIPGVATIQKGNVADIRKLGTSGSAKDVAILKIDGKNLPTLKIGDSGEVKTGDRIYILGYPGASETSLTATGEAIEPTLTSGIISAERKTTDGFRLLQTDAAMSGGNSGGPVFNEKGEVIGIATSGSVDPFTGQPVAGFNFLVPINFAKGFMQELNIQNKQGSVDEHYQEGLEYLWNKKYSKAIDELETVRRLYPAHPYVQSYLTGAQEALER